MRQFNARQAELIGLAAIGAREPSAGRRGSIWRAFISRSDMAAEAKAVLDVALADQRGAEDVTGSVLKAVADVMLDRPDEALKELSNPQVGNQQDAPIWRAIAYARQGKWPEARDDFQERQCCHGRAADRIAAHGDEGSAALGHRGARFQQRRHVSSMSSKPSACRPDWSRRSLCWSAACTKAWAALRMRSPAIAPLRISSDRRAAAQGRLREIVLAFAIGDMPRKDVINDLETLTTVWRGDETETEGLKLLAHLYTEDSRYRDAFHVMRTALLAHPNSDMTRKIQDEAAVTFESLFLGGKGDALPPIEALGLFYDFRELTPIGRRGDEMIRRLADRLVAVDLLDQAAELLQHQVDHRLQGGRARTGRDASGGRLSHEPQTGPRACHLAGDPRCRTVKRTARPAPAARGARHCPTSAGTIWRWN